MKIKKTTIMLSLLSGALVLASCSKDELTGYVPGGETIEVVKNDLLFDAKEGTAIVEVKASGTISASVSSDWCTATVSGNVVSVSVQANEGFEGRTAVLTIRAEQGSRELPVQQRGMVLGRFSEPSHYVPMDGGAFSYTIRHDLPMSLTASASWIHTNVDGELFTINVDQNTTGHLRRGFVVSECAGYRDTLNIAQFDLMNDIIGSYYMMGYYGGVGGQAIAIRFDVVERNDSLFMHWTNDPNWTDTYLPVSLDRGTATLFFPSAMRLYNSGGNSDVAFFYDTNGTVCTSSASGANAFLEYNPTTGFNSARLTAGNWPGHTLGGFIIRSSRGNGLVVQNLLQMAEPVIMRVGPEGTTISDD